MSALQLPSGAGVSFGVSRPSAEEESMGGIDWTNIPLEDFFGDDEEQEDGTVRFIEHPHGDGVAQRLMMRIHNRVQDAYEDLLHLRTENATRPPGRSLLSAMVARDTSPLML
jgi:hypothetical protein